MYKMKAYLSKEVYYLDRICTASDSLIRNICSTISGISRKDDSVVILYTRRNP